MPVFAKRGMASTSSVTAFAMGAMGEQTSTLELVGRIGGSLQSLVAMVSRLPPTPLAPGGEAEAALLRHHLSACGKLREAQSIGSSLLQRPFVVAPGEKIYMDPTVVPTLLSTRANSSNAAAETPAPSGGRPKDAGLSTASVLDRGALQSGVKRHSAMCDALAKAAAASMRDIMLGKRPAPLTAPLAAEGLGSGRVEAEVVRQGSAPPRQEAFQPPRRLPSAPGSLGVQSREAEVVRQDGGHRYRELPLQPPRRVPPATGSFAPQRREVEVERPSGAQPPKRLKLR